MSEPSHAPRKSSKLRREDEAPRQGSARAAQLQRFRDIAPSSGATGSRQRRQHEDAATPISERESIFAENYVHDLHVEDQFSSNAPSSSPLLHTHAANPHQTSPGMAITTITTVTEKRDRSDPTRAFFPRNQQSFDLYLHGHRKGETPETGRPPPRTPDEQTGSLARPAYSNTLPDHILALPPFSSPTDSPKSPPTPIAQARPILDNAIQLGEDNEERWKYRSWRQGHPVLGGRIMASGMGDETGSSVDKKIEATLPRAEQAAVARSRKTSHLLGIFKQNEHVAEQKKEDRLQKGTIAEQEDQIDISDDGRSKPTGMYCHLMFRPLFSHPSASRLAAFSRSCVSSRIMSDCFTLPPIKHARD